MRKPKQSYKPDGRDNCQTPQYALDPLLPYLKTSWLIWESAVGEGNIVRKLRKSGFSVGASDILTGQDFFKYEPTLWDCQITNPPFSRKYEWIDRSFSIGKPFALLLPLETLGAQKAQKLFERYSIEIILLNKRVGYKMPNKGWNGAGAHFPSAWFTWGLNIGAALIYGKIIKYSEDQANLLPQSILW